MKNETQQPKHTPEPWKLDGKFENNTNSVFLVNADRKTVICCMNAYQFWNLTPEKAQANADRIVACVNALAGKPNPQRWVDEVHIMLGKIVSFEHPELRIGDSRLDKIIELAKQRDQLVTLIEGIMSRPITLQNVILNELEKIKGGGHE